MANIFNYPFQAIPSTAPSFNSTLGSAAALYAIESTGAREFKYPSNRVLRVVNKLGDDFHLLIGTSNVVATTSAASLFLGGVVEGVRVEPWATHVSIIGSSTDVAVNFTLGHGGF